MSRNINILIVEDEKSIREVLKLNLELDDYNVVSCTNGKEAIMISQKENIDLVVMDVMLPHVNGIDASREIKSKRPELPIIILSALGQSNDKIIGLKAGADDYMSKPFNYAELLLRIEKQLEKSRIFKGQSDTVKIGMNTVNFTNSTIKNNESQITHLNQKESSLLRYLYQNKNRTISREEIYANVWNYEFFPNSRTVDNHIATLRKALNETQKGEFIKSERGVGYKLLLL